MNTYKCVHIIDNMDKDKHDCDKCDFMSEKVVILRKHKQFKHGMYGIHVQVATKM